MAKWRVRIWETPLDIIVETDTSTQAENKAMVTQGLNTEDVCKIEVTPYKEEEDGMDGFLREEEEEDVD